MKKIFTRSFTFIRRFEYALLAAIGFLVPAAASAHVAYVLPPEELQRLKGADFPYVLSGFKDPVFWPIAIITLVVVVLAVIFIPKIPAVARLFGRMKAKLALYSEYIPWILRLALGMALIGAGTSTVLVSPILTGMPQFAFIQILLGFLFLSGLFVVPAAIVTCCLYLYGLTLSGYLIGNLDMFALAFACIFAHNSRPGLDDILGIGPKAAQGDLAKSWLVPILRFGIGGAMMFLALYEKLFNPHLAQAVVDQYHLTSIIPVSPVLWVLGAALIEFAVGFFIFIGYYTRLVSCIAFLVISLTFFFFKEGVSSHITLFALLSVLVITGGGRWSIDEAISST